MPNQQDIRRIAAAFCPETEPVGIRELTSGNVNATYRLDYDPQDRSRSLVLQRINTEAFRNPEALMENIRLVTGHIRAALVAAGQDPAGCWSFCPPRTAVCSTASRTAAAGAVTALWTA